MTVEQDMQSAPPIQIEITQDDIDNGWRNEAESCPLAFAMTRAGYGSPYINYRSWSADNAQGRIYGWMPDRTRLWLQRYDDGNDMSPTTLTLFTTRIMLNSQKTDS